MFHKDVSTGNIVNCEAPNMCQISNIHASSHATVSKLYATSEKKLLKIDKLSREEAEEILERKTMESSLLTASIDKMEKDVERFNMSGSVSPAFLRRLNEKLNDLNSLFAKTEEDRELLFIYLS